MRAQVIADGALGARLGALREMRSRAMQVVEHRLADHQPVLHRQTEDESVVGAEIRGEISDEDGDAAQNRVLGGAPLATQNTLGDFVLGDGLRFVRGDF